MYKYPLAVTQQFRFCGNPFRLDVYLGCDFGCKYCFANSKLGGTKFKEYDVADINVLRTNFKVINSGKETGDSINQNCLIHRVPLHLGGMADPLQFRDKKLKLTGEVLKLTNEYSYPMMISTKAASLPQVYWDLLDVKLHAFQISLMGYNEDFVRKFETNTPSPQERIKFMIALRDKGFWVSCRIQPLIDIEEAISLLQKIKGIVNFVTLEHIKIPRDNLEIAKLIYNEVGIPLSNFYVPKFGRNYEVKLSIKEKNLERIRQIEGLPLIGVGDNDLHHKSDTDNCCGIDTINDKFDTWIKYNTMYFEKHPNTDKSKIWYPKGYCGPIFSSKVRPGMGELEYSKIVDSFEEKHYTKKFFEED
jgi:DNA repair photolyase